MPNEPKKFQLKNNNGNRSDFFNHPFSAIGENVFKEWFLHSMNVDLGDPSYIEDFQPPIFRTLTINRDLTSAAKDHAMILVAGLNIQIIPTRKES